MFELSQEETIMTSDNGSISLTTHRVSHRSAKGTTQVMLEDFVSYEYRHRHIGNYGMLTFIFGSVSAGLLVNDLVSYWNMRILYRELRVSVLDTLWNNAGTQIFLAFFFFPFS